MVKGRKFFFGCGLPRSGSTLACNIINQRKDMYASATSGLIHIVKPIVSGWERVPEFKANAKEVQKKNLLRGIFEGFYQHLDGVEFVVDKNRLWPSEAELLEYIFDEKPKMVMFVRDVRDILCSWESMYRRDKKLGKPFPGEEANPAAFSTMERRMEFWSDAASVLGSSFNCMRDAMARGYTDCMYFFEYEKWTHDPKTEFSKLYEWLGVPDFDHDFDNVKQVLVEKDEFYGYTDLHNIREGKVEPSEPKWKRFMSESMAKKYESSNIWRKGN